MSDGQIEKFKELFDELMRYCLRRGIIMADAQDLVGASLESALKNFDPERGSFAALAQTALENRVKNHWRDRKPLDPIEGAGDVEDPDAHPDLVDELTPQQERLRGIMAELTAEEKNFLLVLQSVLEEMDSRAVSEAARRLDMPPAKGWDLFRKIQRKAVRKAAKKGRDVRFSLATMAPPPEGSVDESAQMCLEINELPAPYAPSAAGSAPESVGMEMRTLAAFAAMEDAFARFCMELPGDSLALLRSLK
jgi:DNA-directed RNA polymerase specialized sigma24 family protein